MNLVDFVFGSLTILPCSTLMALTAGKSAYQVLMNRFRGMEKVNGEFALIMTFYNLKRTINILGITDLMEKEPDYKSLYLALKTASIGTLGLFIAQSAYGRAA